MRARTRTLTGMLLIVVAVLASALFLAVFLRVGFPRLEDGAKGVVYLWVLTLSIALPLTAGVALCRGSWSLIWFTGWWLLVVALLAFASLLWFLPPYQGWPLSLVVGSAVCVLPPLAGSAFLLLWGKRASRSVEHYSSAGDGGASVDHTPRVG
jgi:hypothetical protein